MLSEHELVQVRSTGVVSFWDHLRPTRQVAVEQAHIMEEGVVDASVEKVEYQSCCFKDHVVLVSNGKRLAKVPLSTGVHSVKSVNLGNVVETAVFSACCKGRDGALYLGTKTGRVLLLE